MPLQVNVSHTVELSTVRALAGIQQLSLQLVARTKRSTYGGLDRQRWSRCVNTTCRQLKRPASSHKGAPAIVLAHQACLHAIATIVLVWCPCRAYVGCSRLWSVSCLERRRTQSQLEALTAQSKYGTWRQGKVGPIVLGPLQQRPLHMPGQLHIACLLVLGGKCQQPDHSGRCLIASKRKSR